MLVAFILVPVGTWAGLGFSTDKAALGLLASNIITGIVMFIKERAGVSVPIPTPPQPKPGP
jgi:cytosine/uracil/thiamine/allantoin permease